MLYHQKTAIAEGPRGHLLTLRHVLESPGSMQTKKQFRKREGFHCIVARSPALKRLPSYLFLHKAGYRGHGHGRICLSLRKGVDLRPQTTRMGEPREKLLFDFLHLRPSDELL